MRRTASAAPKMRRCRTKRPKTRGNVPYVRGCGTPRAVIPENARADASLPMQQKLALSTVATSSSLIEKKTDSTRISSSASSRISARAGVVDQRRAIASSRSPASSALRSLPTPVTRIVSQPSPPSSGSRASSTASAIAVAWSGSRSRASAASSPPSRAPRELGPRRDVRIRVARHVESALARAVDRRQRAVHLAPVLAARGFVVRALHRDFGALADGERLGDRRFELVAFVAHVRGVQRRARAARGARARDELVEVGVAPGLVDQSARHAERAFLDGAAHEPALRLELVALEAARVRPGDAQPRRAEPDQRGDVERDAFALDQREERVEGRPLHVEPVVARVAHFLRARASVQRRDRRAAVAADLGRDPLPDLSFAQWVYEPELVGMRVNVDEPGRQRESFAGDALVCITVGEIPDRDDPAVRDGDVGRVRNAAQAVVDPGPAEDRPEHRLT